MVQNDDEFGELPELSNRDLLRILMQEIVDTRNELIERMNLMKMELKKDVVKVGSDLHTLRLEVHQNQSTFIANHTALERRVKVLEMAA